VKTDDLINALSQDAPVQWRFNRLLPLAVLGGALISAILFFVGIGVRPDIARAVETMRFLFKFVVTLTLAIAALGLMWRLARPGIPTSKWAWTLTIAPLLLLAAVLVEMSVMPASTWETRWIGTNARFCLTLIPVLALGPLACLLLVLRQGAPANPGWAGAVAGLAASGIAATFYASHCPDDSPFFVATWYPLATGIVVLIGYFAGRRWLRW